MWNKQPLLVFTAILSIALFISYFIHAHYVSQYADITTGQFYLSYSVNFILTLAITITLYMLRIKQAHNLGFIFMGGSLFKFLIFFLIFYPEYALDGEISKTEFGLFFIPYAISLTLETTFLIRILNKMD